MQSVPNKEVMYSRLRSGAFGNTAQTWDSYASLKLSGYRGLLGIRSKQPGGVFLPYVHIDEALDGDVIYSEMQRDELIALQGEVYRATDGLYLFASTLKTHMRPALVSGGRHYRRSAAHSVLLAALWPSDYDALMQLLDTYDSVVEFSAYSTAVGIIPNRNTIIWEVRNY